MTVVGHSLGGALALGVGARLIAPAIASASSPSARRGSPSVCNFALWRLAREAGELAEYRRAGDPVPSVPVRPLFKPHDTRRSPLGARCGDPDQQPRDWPLRQRPREALGAA